MIKVTEKEIKSNYRVLTIGYCQAESLLHPLYADLYTSGIYGWNSDIFLVNTEYSRFAISTGYRPIQDIRANYKLLEKYEKLAKEFNKNHSLKSMRKHSLMLLKRLYLESKNQNVKK